MLAIVIELVLMVKAGIRQRPTQASRGANGPPPRLVVVRVLPATGVAHLVGQVRLILIQEEVDCSHLMTALKVLRILMMLIANVVAAVLQELELGTLSHVVSAAVRLAVK